MSLKHIAEIAGTSVSTVSRVLNNTSPNCASQELKEKIWKAVRETGYIPNESARNLKKGKEVQISVANIYILLARIDDLQKDPFFYELSRCVETEILKHHGVVKGIFVLEDSLPALSNKDGIIILGRCPNKNIIEMKKKTKNIIGIWRNPIEEDIDEVVCDGEKAVTIAMEYLFSLGHRQIAYIGDCSSENRYVGYSSFLIKHKIGLNYDAIFHISQTNENWKKVMESLLQQIKLKQLLVSAILCANDIVGIGILEELNKYPKKVREQISVISIDDIEKSSMISPMLTTVHIPKEEMAHMGVMILKDHMNGGHKEKVRVEFQGKLMVRDSCQKLRYDNF